MTIHTRSPDGFIAPERIYTTEGVFQAIGLARESLRNARASGLVKPIKVGRLMYYEGAEIIAWIRSHNGQAEAQQADYEEASRLLRERHG